MTALKEGASRAGKEITIYLTKDDSNFSDAERKDIDKNLPQNCYFIGDDSSWRIRHGAAFVRVILLKESLIRCHF